MGDTKLVSKKIAITLGLLCIVLLASTVGVALYFSGVYANYAATHSRSDEEYIALSSQFVTLNTTISDLNKQISNLESELSNNNTQLKDLTTQVTNLKAEVANHNKTVTTLQDYYNSLIYVLNTDNHEIAGELMNATNKANALQSQVDTLTAIASLNASSVWISNQTVNQAAGAYTTWNQTAAYAGYIAVIVSSSTSSNAYASVSYSSHGVDYNVQTTVGSTGTAYFPVLPANVAVTVGNGLSTGTAFETVSIIYYY